MEKPGGWEGLSGRDNQTGRRGGQKRHELVRGGYRGEENTHVWARGLSSTGDFSFSG